MFTENPLAKPRNQLRVILKTIYALNFGREILTRSVFNLNKNICKYKRPQQLFIRKLAHFTDLAANSDLFVVGCQEMSGRCYFSIWTYWWLSSKKLSGQTSHKSLPLLFVLAVITFSRLKIEEDQVPLTKFEKKAKGKRKNQESNSS